MKKLLIQRVKNGEQDAFEELLDEHSKMIYSIIQKHELIYGDYMLPMEDLFQEGSLGLMEAVQKYDEEKMANFGTFAYMLIRRRVNRYYFELVNTFRAECFSYSKFENIDRSMSIATDYVSDNPISYHKQEELREEMSKRWDNYTDFEREVIRLKVKGYSYKQIGERLNCNEKRIDNVLQKIRRKYQKEKDDENYS